MVWDVNGVINVIWFVVRFVRVLVVVNSVVFCEDVVDCFEYVDFVVGRLVNVMMDRFFELLECRLDFLF